MRKRFRVSTDHRLVDVDWSHYSQRYRFNWNIPELYFSGCATHTEMNLNLYLIMNMLNALVQEH